jgi:hypothetical protein
MLILAAAAAKFFFLFAAAIAAKNATLLESRRNPLRDVRSVCDLRLVNRQRALVYYRYQTVYCQSQSAFAKLTA